VVSAVLILGVGPAAAVERTSATAGRTITFSALTVATSLSGLFLFDSPMYRAIAATGVSVVLIALDAGLTLVPGSGTEPVTVVARSDTATLTAYARQVAAVPGVARVGTPQQRRPGVASLDVVPTGANQGPTAQRVVTELRTTSAGVPTYVTGDAAFLVDFKDEIAARMPWALGFIAPETFVLLFLMTGSVLVPVKALVMNVLSLGASFGALVLVFQDGHLSGLLGFDSPGALETWVPVIVFVFAFGMSMDYEVFLLARVKELYDAGLPNARAVVLGLQRSGRIITSAALLVVIVFAGFGAGKMLGIKQMGLALAMAVLVDATLVRCLLVPATMTLLGDRNWWAPGPLRRLHDQIGLREQPAGAADVAE
jgi:RND superfamily putative drug exporter